MRRRAVRGEQRLDVHAPRQRRSAHRSLTSSNIESSGEVRPLQRPVRSFFRRLGLRFWQRREHAPRHRGRRREMTGELPASEEEGETDGHGATPTPVPTQPTPSPVPTQPAPSTPATQGKSLSGTWTGTLSSATTAKTKTIIISDAGNFVFSYQAKGEPPDRSSLPKWAKPCRRCWRAGR